MRILKFILTLLLLLIILAIGLFYYSLNNHVSIGEYEKWYEGINTNPDQSGLKIQFVGVSTLVISDDSTTIMTDGFFSRFPSWDMLFGEIEPQKADIKWAVDKLAMEKLDAILVVHSHFDHAMDAPEVAKLTGAPMYGSQSTSNIGRGWDLPENQIKVFQDGQAMQFGKIKVTPILSNHYAFANAAVKKNKLWGEIKKLLSH